MRDYSGRATDGGMNRFIYVFIYFSLGIPKYWEDNEKGLYLSWTSYTLCVLCVCVCARSSVSLSNRTTAIVSNTVQSPVMFNKSPRYCISDHNVLSRIGAIDLKCIATFSACYWLNIDYTDHRARLLKITAI